MTRAVPSSLLAAALTLLVVGCATPGPDDDVTALRVGVCFTEPESGEVTEVPRVDCAEAHDLEVYAVPQLAGTDYPGHEAVVAEAGRLCADGFADFLGLAYADALQGGYDFTSLYPTEQSWDLGDRDVVCAIATTTPDGLIRPHTGTLKGAER